MVTTNSKNEDLNTAISVCNNPNFVGELYQEILKVDSFDMSTASTRHIAKNVMSVLLARHIKVNVYYPKWRWSKALGYFTPSRPYDININGYKLNRTVESFVGTIVHEAVHMADNQDGIESYGHGDNGNSHLKKDTAPYKIGNLAVDLASSYLEASDNLEMETYGLYKPWYLRFYEYIKKLF